MTHLIQETCAIYLNKLALYRVMVDSSQLTFVLSSKARDTKTRTNIRNQAGSNLDIVP